MHFQRVAALGAVLVVGACQVPVSSSDPSLGVVSVAIQPKTITVLVGDSVRLSANLVLSKGNLPPTITWNSSNPGLATVTGAGVVRGVATGAVVIRAASAGKADSAAVAVVIPSPLPPLPNPGTVSDLAVTAVTLNSVTLAFTEVNDGTGKPASYDVRYAAGSTVAWAGTPSVASGTCTTPMAGAAIGATRSCTVLGLAASTTYSFELVAFRGTLKVDAVFGGVSNIATGTTAASTAPVASVSVIPGNATVVVGGTQQLTATLKDVTGNVLSGRTVSWSSSASTVATVNGTGLVSAVAAGSATVTATSEGNSGTAVVTVSSGGGVGQVTYYRTNFTDGTTGPLDVYAYGGGVCGASSDYRDPGSAYSMKCTIPGGTGAAALQAWFGTGKLAGLPKDPSLDQDVFEQVRFVLAPGAEAAIGGMVCTALNRTTGFKVHKSVYGQAGSAWNGWVMTSIGQCSNGNIGLATENEMWNIDGRSWVWPNMSTTLHEGSVFDVVYRYHRYTAQSCGTVAVWVNGAKVMDTPCESYMGTTNGSTAGLLFWDGATYLQDGLGPFTVYTLFAQATNYPIGPATPSP
jgi:uncharacterized protein YjdB